MSRFTKYVFQIWVTLFILVGANFQAATAAEATIYSFAVLPGAPPTVMSKMWTPVIERLTEDTGIVFRLKFFDQMAEFEREIWSGAPDFIYASPIQTVVARQGARYIPLVRDSKMADIKLYVRQDSPIRSVDDLDKKQISFVGNKNICSVYMQHELRGYGKNLTFVQNYAGSTKNVILNVLMGKTDAGAVFASELEREPAESRAQLREVASTPKFAPHPLSAHPRVPAQIREAVKKAMLKLAATTDGEALLRPMRLDDLVEADYDKDYRALEKIDIKGMTNWGQ
jgi:phosphonate transport system substrate-binding protein